MLSDTLPATYPPASTALPAASPAAPETAKRFCLKSIFAAYRTQCWVALGILILGTLLRLVPHPTPHQQTMDERLYMGDLRALEIVGLFQYPAVVENYIHEQTAMQAAMLPPTRFLYIVSAYGWNSVFHTDERASLESINALFSMLAFLLAGVCATRLGGSRYGLAVFALMAVAPMQLQMAHGALSDGFFAFWALLAVWLLWENLQKPGRAGWLVAYALSISAMVMTKENAFFAFLSLLALVGLAKPLGLGKVTRETVGASVAGAVFGLAAVMTVSGGAAVFIQTFRLFVSKVELMSFAYQTGGGPYFRYLVDLLLMSPAVLLPAIGTALNVRKEDKAVIYLLLFVVISYAMMTNVKNGMNLRYCTMWDMPLRFLAVTQLFRIAARVRRAPQFTAIALVTLVGLLELRQYHTFFIRNDLGELVTIYMLRALEIIRPALH